jgi:Glycosyltransferase family 87
MIEPEHVAIQPPKVVTPHLNTDPEFSFKRLSVFLWLLTAGLDVALSVYVLTRAKYSGEDSWFPMGRALDFLRAAPSGKLVYQQLFFLDHIKFQYPPTALLPLDFLRVLGVRTSLALNFINAGLLIATGCVFAAFTVQLLGRVSCGRIGIPIGPLAFFLALRFYPNNLAFQIGQMQILLGLLFLLACWSFLNNRLSWVGCLIGFAATVKPQLAPLGVVALWQRQWRLVGGFIVVTVPILLLSIVLYGWRTHLDYLNVLDFLSKHGEYQHLNQSINGILSRWLYAGPSLDRDPNGMIPQSAFPPFLPVVYFATLISSLVMMLIPFIVRSRADDCISRLLAFCNASVLFTMASPIAWIHHYNILLGVFVVAAKAGFDRWIGVRAWVAMSLLAASFVLVGYPLVPAAAPTIPSMNVLQSHVFIGAVILVGVMLIELRTPLRNQRPLSRPLIVS